MLLFPTLTQTKINTCQGVSCTTLVLILRRCLAVAQNAPLNVYRHLKYGNGDRMVPYLQISHDIYLHNFKNCRCLLEAPGVKERKLAGWGLSRGKTWKGSLNVTRKKNAPQMEANTAMLEDALTMKPFSSCCIWRRSRQPKWNGSRKTSKICILPGFHSPVMQKTL